MNYLFIIAALFATSYTCALTQLDDLLIKNNTHKTIGILWFIGNDYTQTGIANMLSPGILAPKGKQLPSQEPYFHNTDSKSLKKAALQEILGRKKEITGALFFDLEEGDQQVLVKFADTVTGTVKRDGNTYQVNAMTIIAPPEYALESWNVVKGYDVQPADYARNPKSIGQRQ